MELKLAIGCHNYLLGEGLKRLLEEKGKIKVIRIFNEGASVKEIVELKPDIVLAEFNITFGLPDDFLSHHQIKILLIGDRAWRLVANKQIMELVSRGVVGILPPDADSNLLKEAIQAVYSGKLWIDSKILYSGNHFEQRVHLTRKEKEIASLICQGYRNKEIARKLNISEQTVKSHCNRIYKKIGISDRLQMALSFHKMYSELGQF